MCFILIKIRHIDGACTQLEASVAPCYLPPLGESSQIKQGLLLYFEIFITLTETIYELEADSRVKKFPSNGLVVYLASKKSVGAWFSHLGTAQATLGIQRPLS